MIRGLVIFVLLCCSSLLSAAPWPSWLGDDLKPQKGSHWQIETTAEGVEFMPARSAPTILMVVSRKADSYDTALKTLLAIYARELPQAHIVVRLLPVEAASVNSARLISMLKKAESNVDLIYSIGSKATVALRRVYSGGKIPVVSVNAKDPVLLGLIENELGSGDNFAFTSLNLPAPITLRYMKRFKPSLKQIGVLYAKSNQSAYATQYLPLKKTAEQQGIKITAVVVEQNDPSLTLEVSMKRAIKELKEDDPSLTNSILWLTGSSSLLVRMQEINFHAGELAVLSAVPDVVNSGPDSALMSFGVSFVNNAHQAGLYGLQILSGRTAPGDLPVGQISPPDIAISFAQAQRINQKIPFVLMEMASDVYGSQGTVIRSQGESMQEQQ
ncbi:ABC transporter substrate-binding protein [Psychromonas ossibalaenae]|uniref:ABC transporter substrate-binding protein n=1 Tax=Psychromonas ossibalaenae TaxID=444922 RepID=UPI0003678880|nr:ABC transporter substrate binding protein [Psychromonas ossibalaenae]